MDNKKELKERLLAKKKELEARMHNLNAETSKEAAEKKMEIEHKLNTIQESVESGWEDLSDKAVEKLNKLLAE